MSAGSACVTCTTRQFGIGKTSFINHYILFNLKKFQIPETGHSTQSAEEPIRRTPMLGETQEQVLHLSRSAGTSMRAGGSGMSRPGRAATWKDEALIGQGPD